MNWNKIEKEGVDFIKFKKLADGREHGYNDARRVVQSLEDEYGRSLKRVVTRLVNSALKNQSSQHVRVNVSPLVNHNDYTCAPFVTINWPCIGGRFDFEAIIKDEIDLGRLIRRFVDTVRINGCVKSTKS